MALVLIFLGVRQYDSDVKTGKIKGDSVEKTISQSYGKIADIIKEYREVAAQGDKDNWADELGVNVKPLIKNQNPSIFAEKAADMLQNFMRTKKGMELFERLLLTPPSSDGSVDIIGLGRGASIPYFNISRFDKKLGTGSPLECGQQVVFKYSARLQGTKEIHSNFEEKPEVTRIGEFKYIPGIEYYLIGMRPGGERDVIIPPSQAYGVGSKFFDDQLASKFVLVHMEMLKNLSKEPDYKDFNLSSEAPSSGRDLALCGDKVKISYQVFNREMKPISGRFSRDIVIGGADLPIGISKALEGMSPEEVRRADIPRNLQKNFDGNRTAFFNNVPNLPDEIVVKIYSAKKLPLYE